MEQNWPRGTMHGQIAMHVGRVIAGSVHRCALKRDRRKLLGIEKFSREQMLVAVLDASIDALDLNGRLYTRSLRLCPIENHRSGKICEFTGDAAGKLTNLKMQF